MFTTTLRSVAVGLAAFALAQSAVAASERLAIEILHTNDIHGYLRPNDQGKGGAGAVATIVDAARLRAKKEADYGVLVMDAGDLQGGGAEDSFSRGAMMADYLFGAGYDVYTPGNHDFGYGMKVLTDMTRAFRAKGGTALAVNIRKMQGGDQATDVCDGSAVFTVKGVKVGVVGATTPGTERMNLDENVEGLHFADPIEPVKKEVREIKKHGANVVVMLSHVGLDNARYVDDKKIAAAVKDLRVVVGGHSHTTMDKPFIEPTNKAVIVQAGSQGRWLGSLTLYFDKKTHEPLDENGDGAIDHEYKLIELSREPGAHELASSLKSKYWDPVQTQLETKVGDADIGLYRKYYKTESQLGNLLADAMLEAAPGSQIALSATSELRADLRRGPIATKDVFEVVPFDNEVVKLKIAGYLIKEIIDGVFGEGRRFVNVAGMEILVDSRKPEGQRVQSIKIGGKEIDDNTKYDLSTTDFMAQGKGGFKQFENKPKYEKTGISNREALTRRIQKLKTVTAEAIEMHRVRDAALEEEIGKVTRVFSTEMNSQSPNLFDLVAQSVLGNPARGDLALIDTSAIHWKLSEKFPVVKKDLFELVSYDNKIVTASITGAQLSALFKSMLSKGERRFVGYVAGGNLVITGSDFQLLIGDKPVEAAKTYKLVTYDHLLTGPKGFEALGDLHLQPTVTTIAMRASLEEWIKKASPVGLEDFPSRPGVVLSGQAAARTANRVVNFERIKSDEDEEAKPHTHDE